MLYDDCFRVASRTGVPYYIETMLSFCSFLMLHGGFEESYENLKAVAEAVLQEEEHVVKIYENARGSLPDISGKKSLL